MSVSINKYKLIPQFHTKSVITESYRSLCTNIHYASVEKQVKTIMVTSTFPNEGKSTTISNLGISYAQAGKKVLLIDADLRNPTLHRVFHASNRLGLSNLLVNQCKIEDVIMDVLIPNLNLIPGGQLLPNPAELLDSSSMEVLLSQLKPLYDIILIDSSPILAVSDSMVLSSKCEGVLFIVKHGGVKREAAQKALAKLEHVKANVIGVILNNKKRTKNDYVYYY
ncbi:CpsD/CapB family tyrosine-protein kinase [Cohnella sp. WQ 127256]|uniref:CpsD/CapB family tyrosine-protein kinase n=1 Tax=Cohnella sp. WQ 127256 TaxID=2938790 RepID=UPI00211773E9|nr:CpsD/CapB family tyrosine-protein kinase [Cohnella sp. WQ 127256]